VRLAHSLRPGRATKRGVVQLRVRRPTPPTGMIKLLSSRPYWRIFMRTTPYSGWVINRPESLIQYRGFKGIIIISLPGSANLYHPSCYRFPEVGRNSKFLISGAPQIPPLTPHRGYRRIRMSVFTLMEISGWIRHESPGHVFQFFPVVIEDAQVQKRDRSNRCGYRLSRS
jgi:hypothetical protein